ncbi:hypothetical protein D3C75_831720 [compost metagenome]
MDSLKDALSSPAFNQWLEQAKERAKQRTAEEGSQKRNSIASESASSQYQCPICKDLPQSKLIPVIDPNTGEQIIEVRPKYGPNNVITGYHEIPRVEWVDVPCECEEWKAAKKRLESGRNFERSLLQITPQTGSIHFLKRQKE